MQVHARFYLAEDGRSSYWISGTKGPVDAARVKLAAVKGEPFGPATPQGTIDMLIVNPEAIPAFRNVPLGTEFDVIFTPVAESE